ncbi:glycosyltransferase [Aeoliella mucimassa]|nr:glycosyltransferase [Aeoliella mucimassa]
MPSQTFIRREIKALEDQGFRVQRYALRPWPGKLVDALDQREHEQTRYIATLGVAKLLLVMISTMFRKPARLLKAFSLLRKVSRRSDRSLFYHLIYLAEACVLDKWLQNDGVKHLHVHFATNPTEVAMYAHVLGDHPYSFMVHGPEEFDRAACVAFDEKASRAKFVATITSFARSQLYRWVRFEDWPKIQVVHCGLDHHYLEREYEPPVSTNRLVCVGRLGEQKGHMTLLEAAAIVARTHPSFELALVGDGELRGEVEKSIAKHGLHEQVKLLGWADGEQVQEQLRQSTALVLASFAEGLPVVIMEALAMGRPVISTMIAGIPELVVTGKNGWLVPAGDAESLAAAIMQLLETPQDTLVQMGHQAIESVQSQHNVTIEAKKLAAHILA